MASGSGSADTARDDECPVCFNPFAPCGSIGLQNLETHGSRPMPEPYIGVRTREEALSLLEEMQPRHTRLVLACGCTVCAFCVRSWLTHGPNTNCPKCRHPIVGARAQARSPTEDADLPFSLQQILDAVTWPPLTRSRAWDQTLVQFPGLIDLDLGGGANLVIETSHQQAETGSPEPEADHEPESEPSGDDASEPRSGNSRTDSETASDSSWQWENEPPLPPREVPRHMRPHYPRLPENMLDEFREMQAPICDVYKAFDRLYEARSDTWVSSWREFAQAATAVMENPVFRSAADYVNAVTRSDISRADDLRHRLLDFLRDLLEPTASRRTRHNANMLAEMVMDDVFDTSNDHAAAPHVFYISRQMQRARRSRSRS